MHGLGILGRAEYSSDKFMEFLSKIGMFWNG